MIRAIEPNITLIESNILSIEPNVGGFGTTVEIKGENFDKNEIEQLLICNIDCTSTIEWISTKCIKAMIISNYKARNGKGDVIMILKSGGKSVSTVTFELNITRINLLEESDFWIDENVELLLPSLDEKVQAPVDTFEVDPLGILNNETSHTAKIKASINSIINQYGLTGSASLFDENFSVNKFLVTRHYSTTFIELKVNENCNINYNIRKEL